MPDRKRALDTSRPPEEYEVTIQQAIDSIMALWDAIEIAKQGKRGDIIMVGTARVAISGAFAGENSDVQVTVCPEHDPPTLKLV